MQQKGVGMRTGPQAVARMMPDASRGWPRWLKALNQATLNLSPTGLGQLILRLDTDVSAVKKVTGEPGFFAMSRTGAD